MIEEPSAVAAASLELSASGTWRVLSSRAIRRVDGLAEMVQAFAPLDHPAGHAAARFLKEEAAATKGVVTRVVIGEERVEGFIATTFTELELTRVEKKGLGLTRHHSPVPAFYLTWVARHRDSSLRGIELIGAAYGLAAEAAELGGLRALVLDPADAAVQKIWTAPPYNFRLSDTPSRPDGVAKKLWIPVI